MAQSIPRIIISRVAGFLFFLILLAIANYLIPNINSEIYKSTVIFFNNNLILLLILMFVGIVNEIFWIFYFPFNLLAPVSSSILGVFIAGFIYRMWNFLDAYINSGLRIPIDAIYVLLFFIILIAGYFTILVRKGKPKEEYERSGKFKDKNERTEKKKNVEWENIGNEFRLVLYNVGNSINNLFKKRKRL